MKNWYKCFAKLIQNAHDSLIRQKWNKNVARYSLISSTDDNKSIQIDREWGFVIHWLNTNIPVAHGDQLYNFARKRKAISLSSHYIILLNYWSHFLKSESLELSLPDRNLLVSRVEKGRERKRQTESSKS